MDYLGGLSVTTRVVKGESLSLPGQREETDVVLLSVRKCSSSCGSSLSSTSPIYAKSFLVVLCDFLKHFHVTPVVDSIFSVFPVWLSRHEKVGRPLLKGRGCVSASVKIHQGQSRGISGSFSWSSQLSLSFRSLNLGVALS